MQPKQLLSLALSFNGNCNPATVKTSMLEAADMALWQQSSALFHLDMIGSRLQKTLIDTKEEQSIFFNALHNSFSYPPGFNLVI